MIPDLFSGSFLPHVCIFGFVNQAQSQGQWTNSPFEFNPHNVKDLFILVSAYRAAAPFTLGLLFFHFLFLSKERVDRRCAERRVNKRFLRLTPRAAFFR